MAESARQKRMRELGVISSTTTPTNKPSTSTLSAREIRKMELGVIPDTRYAQAVAKNKTEHADAVKKFGEPVTDITKSPAFIEAKKQSPVDTSKPTWNGIIDNPIGRTIGKGIKAVDVLSQDFAKYATPDAPMFTKDGKLDPNTTAREQYLKDNPQKSTGNKSLDKALDVAGHAGEFYAPGAGVSNIASLTRATESAITKAVPKLATTAGGKVAQKAATEAIVGAPLGAGQALQQGQDDKDIVKGAAAGAVLGGGLTAAGAGAKAFADDAVSKVMRGVFQKVSQKNNINPVRLKVSNPEESFNAVIPKIFKDATERMTPPLENETALAKWVQGHLNESGYNVSLNEVKKLGYEDLRSTAADIRKEFKLPDVVKKSADDLGYGQIYDKTAPNLNETIAANESKRAYGISAPKVDIQRENFKATPGKEPDIMPDLPEENPIKQSFFQRLFGDQSTGISAFGAKNERTGTGTQIVDKPIKNTIEGAFERTKAAGRSVYQSQIDMNDPLKSISKATYDTAIDAQRSHQIANTTVSDKFVDLQGNVIDKGLREIIRQHAPGKYNELTDYIIARHAPTRMRRGEQVYDPKLGMTPEKVEARVKELEARNPEFKNIGNEWDTYYKNIRNEYGVKEGLITPELAKYLEDQNPHYASMMRQFSDKEKFAKPTTLGSKPAFSGQKAPIKEVSPTGSARKIVDPVRSAIEATGAWVQSAMRNRVMQKVVDAISSDSAAMKGIAEIVQPPKGQRDLMDILKNDGEEAFLQAMQDDFDGLFKRSRLDQDNIVRAMVKGKPVYVKVHDPEAVKALLGMGPEQSNLVMDVFKALSTATKYGATGALAPMFAVKGAVIDLPTAIIQSKNPLAHIFDLGHALISSIANELKIPGLRNLAQDFERSGGGYSAALRGERSLRKGVRDMKRRPLLSPYNVSKAVIQPIALPLKGLYKISDMSENVHRIAAFRGEMRRLGGQKTPENVQKAMEAAREITTNYSRRGRQSKAIESFIPYHNAAVQGMYRFARQWKKNPIKTAGMVTTAILLPKLYEYSKFHDDEDYNNLPARERYRNLIVGKNKDGTFKKIPMAPEYNAIGALFSDMLRSYKDGDPEAFKGAADSVVNAYSPPIVSGAAQGFTQGGGIEQSLKGLANATVGGPGVATIANQSFTGAPIVPQRLQDNSPEFQTDERTSRVANAVGRKLGLAPLKVDYLLRAYGGDPARLILPLTSDAGGGNPKATLLKNFIVDPVFTNTLSNDFYDAKDKYTKVNNDYTQFDKPLPKWFDEGIHKMLTSQAKGSVSKILSALAEDKRTVQGDKTLSSKDKAAKLRDIQVEINTVYVDSNTELLKAGYKFPNR